MSLSIVDALDVIDINPTIVISVEDIVSLEDDLLSAGVHWATDGTDELIELKETGLIIVEVSEKLLHFTFSEAEHKVSACLGEFKLIKRTGVVVVHNLELSLESDESTGTA
jgi:hypothetical protein